MSNFVITYYEAGRPDAPVRPEVVIEGYDRDHVQTLRIVWSVQDDRAVSTSIADPNSMETAIKLLECWLRAECHWSEPHSLRGICKLWDHLEETIEADMYAERIAENQALISGFSL